MILPNFREGKCHLTQLLKVKSRGGPLSDKILSANFAIIWIYALLSFGVDFVNVNFGK